MMFSQRFARQAQKQAISSTQKHFFSTEVVPEATATTAAVTKPNRLRIPHGSYKEKLRVHQRGTFDVMIDNAYARTQNHLKGIQNKIQTSKYPPLYPFRPHSVHPITGDYVTRPGIKQPGVIDIDTTLNTQILHYKRRMVNHHMNTAKPEHVVGDQVIYQSRVESNKERLTILFDDTIRPFLSRQTRVSPIYKDATPELRTPRVPLPADTHTMISPTAGVLHVYRMHWVRMYLNTKRRARVWEKQLPFSNVYDYDPAITPIKGANNAGLQEFMYMVKGVAAARNSNFVGGDTMALISGVKKILPMVAKVDKVEVIKIRRRKK